MTTPRKPSTPGRDKGCPIFKEIPGHPGRRCQGDFPTEGQAPGMLSIKSPSDLGNLTEEEKGPDDSLASKKAKNAPKSNPLMLVGGATSFKRQILFSWSR